MKYILSPTICHYYKDEDEGYDINNALSVGLIPYEAMIQTTCVVRILSTIPINLLHIWGANLIKIAVWVQGETRKDEVMKRPGKCQG